MADIEMSESLVLSHGSLADLDRRLDNAPKDNRSALFSSTSGSTRQGSGSKKKPNPTTLEEMIGHFVPEDLQLDATKAFGQLLRRIKMSHQEELTQHLEKVNGENRAKMGALLESQKENGKKTDSILSILIAMRGEGAENASKKPKVLDGDQVRNERALGFNRGLTTAAIAMKKFKLEDPLALCKGSVKRAALSAMEKEEYDGERETYSTVSKAIKAELDKLE
nr:P protein [Viral hemorrhagic septicemia virus]